MKCALELVAESLIAEEKIKKEREERDRARYQEIEKNTIQYCENVIAKYLDACAKTGSPIKCSLKFTVGKSDVGGLFVSHPLEPEKIRYADGAHSLAIRWGTSISLHILKKYLEQFCFEVSALETTYNSYGWGRDNKGVLITISAPDSLPCGIITK